MNRNINEIVKELVSSENLPTKEKCLDEIWTQAVQKGIYPASIQELYEARGQQKIGGFTVPAINLRGLTYILARAIFRVAKKHNAGAFIFEIAKSEMGYTDQRPAEYVGVCLAAAIKEDYQGPVFIQGDHFQVNAKKYSQDPKGEVQGIKDFIKESIASGFYNIDIDTSTLVDLEKPSVKEQQKLNYEICAELTKYIRLIEPKGITISVGGEIGEVGSQNSTPEDLDAFMEGYLETLPDGTKGISKISVQTGTSHGGVVLPDGNIAEVKLDFEVLRSISEIGKEKYGLAGAVQHGASTLPDEAFGKFPEVETAEVHLATGFQNMIYESKHFPADLREKMYKWLQENMQKEKKPNMTEEQFIYKTRKKALGPFKREMYNLSDEILESIGKELEAKFD
ncbi:MAG: class II fructose-bisphosphate aldolase, partial [Candidatus Omnitrophica bacterium]|nr:class II fructose-bisphosphate aldolase [Candidatus Omnitrophota bacterium]